MTPALSLITSFRNRETIRVKRFLESLSRQTFDAFELVFVDYGSDAGISSEVKLLCEQYSFCRYHFNNSRGMYWNRSHAMNSGAKVARGDWLLMTDIDLIYSPEVLQELHDQVKPRHHFYRRAFMLPSSFTAYDQLSSVPTDFKRSHFKTKGLFQCIESSLFHEMQGFDEYYSIWGLEDNDLYERAIYSKSEVRWIKSEHSAIYHQWHPSSAKLAQDFPSKWWERMHIHHDLQAHSIRRNPNGYGKMLTEGDRPTLTQTPATTKTAFSELELHGRVLVISDIIQFLQDHQGQVFCLQQRHPVKTRLDWKRQSKSALVSKGINLLNALSQRLKLPISIIHNKTLRTLRTYTFHAEDTVLTPENIQYVIFYLIKDTDLVKDYAVTRTDRYTEYRLVG